MENDKHYATVVLDESLRPAISGLRDQRTACSRMKMIREFFENIWTPNRFENLWKYIVSVRVSRGRSTVDLSEFLDSGLSSPDWPNPCPSGPELTDFDPWIPGQLRYNDRKWGQLPYLLPNDGVTVNAFKGFLRELVSD